MKRSQGSRSDSAGDGGADDAAGPGSADSGHRQRKLNPVEVAVRRVDKLQQDHGALAFPFAVMQKFGNDQAGSKAALIAYYGLFALFPLLLLFTTILGFVLHNNEALRKQLLNSALGSFPIIGPQLESHTHGLSGSAPAIVVSCLLLLYGAVGLGLATQNAMNTVWNIPYVHWPSLPLRYLRGVAVLGLLALSTIGSTFVTGFATVVSHGLADRLLLLVGSLALNFALILIAFMVMTAEPLTWRDVAFGAALATVFWQALQFVGSWYVGRELQHSSQVYGFFGIVIALLTWIYLGAQLFLLAAEINVVQRYRLWPRSVTQPPLTQADKKVFARLARMEIRRPETDVGIRFLPEAEYDPLLPATAAGPEPAD
jgi:YihY family inner membrane protein